MLRQLNRLARIRPVSISDDLVDELLVGRRDTNRDLDALSELTVRELIDHPFHLQHCGGEDGKAPCSS
jgi:hypothetical protein